MGNARWDETWHRLREWTLGQGPSERLAAQVLIYDGFTGLDPSHPLGGPDGGKDAICMKGGNRWVMAAYFPRGQQTITAIRKKLLSDLKTAMTHSPYGIVFVTNQELTLSQRKSLQGAKTKLVIDLFHLERITSVLDTPAMASVREQFLGIAAEDRPVMQFGGIGGLAPSAGGGGGGAFGRNARGGKGGQGGRMIFAGTPGMAPGAGGGGEGVSGDDVEGGDGGGGGDYVQVMIGPEKWNELSELGLDRFEIRVGRGGTNGGPGEDTIVNLVDKNGQVLNTIAAKGGLPGSPVKTAISGRSASALEVQGGLRIAAMLLAECVQVKGGLLNLPGAGWSHFTWPSMPFEAVWQLCLSVYFGSAVEVETTLKFEAVVRDPTGFQVCNETFALRCDAQPVRHVNHFVTLRFSGSTPGIWTIAIQSDELILASLPIEIRVA